MISNKKSYAMKMLQLALALSLLHYNPDYLLHRWDSQLELSSHGDGWELEMLRSVHRMDMDQNPYGNRKGLSPRIEDFLNFDIPSLGGVGNGVGEYKLPQHFNGSTFVMNLHNTTGNSSVQTAALQDVQSSSAAGTPSSVVVGGASAPTSGGASSGSALGEINIDTSSLAAGNTNHSLLHPAPELDIFLSPHLLQDQRSIWEQNLADLQDYNDLPLQASPYANLPLKDGQQQPPNSSHLDLSLAALIHGFTGAGNASPLSTAALNDSNPHPRSLGSITVEHLEANNSAGRNRDYVEESMYLGRLFGEEETDEDESEMASGAANACEVEGLTTDEPFGSATFANEVIIGDEEEESEIAEVLYKQDVDLGFSLDQEKIINASNASGNTGASSAKSKYGDESKSSDPSMSDSAIKDANDNAEKEAGEASVDDIEKLKALEELQQDKDKDNENPLEDITNEWNGIPFTIDNETGEYIRLPLDELLNDVLKLSEFPLEDELSNDPVASTSQAAAALNENQAQRIVSETGEDFLSGEGVPSKQRRIGAEDKDNDQDKADGDSFSVSDFEDLQNSVGSPLFDLDEDAKKELDEMLQSTAPPYHHPHPHHGHPHAHPHPHSHHHATMHHAHAHHAAAAAAAHQRAVQQANYGGGVGVGVGVGVGSGTGSAFQRQPAAGGFHHGHHQGRMPRLNRSVSMERLQDFATYFSPIPSMVGGVSDMSPYPHHYPGYSYQASPSNGGNPSAPGQHGQYGGGAAAPLQPPPPPPPHHAAMLHHPNAALGDICPTGQPHYGHNLGSAVTSSMHLTNSSHEADGAAAAAAAYKVEHDLMYYGNTSSDMNQADGFMNSIFTDEDLHLMDMNESFCRMVDNSTSNNSSVLGLPSSGHVSNGSGSSAQLAAGNPHGNQANGAAGGVGPMSGTGAAGMTTDLLASGGAGAQGGTDRLDASSDSAVSSMGSERVPSLSDGEWGEGSDSAQDYHQGKYGGPYDFSYNNNSRLTTATRQPPVAQKKHQLYGKRDPHKQTPSALPPTAPPATATAVQSQSIKYEYDAGYSSSGMASGGISEPGAMGPALSKDYNHHQAYGMGASGSGFSGDYTMRPSPRTSQDLVQLNHTYSLPQGSGSLPRPQARDKKTVVATKTATKGTNPGSSNSSAGGGSSSSSNTLEDEHLTRDEKRARSLNIPIPVQDIINLPMDEFNERLSKYDLSENQLSLIRDIRRRGKNKVAAQNCRKRKLDQILTLEDEVNAVVKRKAQLNADRDHLEGERKRISNKFALLHRHVFQYLRDPEGNPCSPADYSLQQAADGSVYLLPRDKTEGNSTATAASNAVSSASGVSLNGHVPAQPSMHGHHGQHGMQAQHVGGGLPQQQQQSRLPPHLQQQQQHHLQSQQQPGGQQQQQHRKE